MTGWIGSLLVQSPELVAQLGKDYTVYAYDYSEYETPLVGQGMLSWVLASASPTPDAPAHQSKTMVTGRVCKNPMGLFSKGAGQDTLEVKLRLVPVPTVMQNEYLDSMHKYRETNVAPRDFDTQSWANFVRQTPGLTEGSRSQQQDHASSPVDHSGIERFHQMLSEGATPRELSNYAGNESVRSASPTHSFANGSRVSTPGGSRNFTQQSQSRNGFAQSSDMIRPSSSVSMRDADYYQSQPTNARRESVQSGYASGGDDPMDSQPRKRAKLYQANWPGKSDMNIERQPSSLRVAASTAASVRIHRPTPVNPSIAAEQSNEEPVRPPTPINRLPNNQRRGQLQSSSLRESSVVSTYQSPYMMSDDIVSDQTAHSPEDPRYQGLFEPAFTMPSSPPVFEGRLPPKSSPVLPPIALDADSGFMSAGLEDILEDDIATTVEEHQRAECRSAQTQNHHPTTRNVVEATSPISAVDTPQPNSNNAYSTHEKVDNAPKPPVAIMPRLPPRTTSSSQSRPGSRNGPRLVPKPPVSTPTTPADTVSTPRPSLPPTTASFPSVPASDPVLPSHPPLQHSQTWAGPMSDFHITDPSPKADDARPRSRASAKKRTKQIQDRLESAIKAGQVPPFCENCGCIETPTWRRTWSKEFVGNDEQAKAMMEEPHMLFYSSVERNNEDVLTKFKIFKKTILPEDNEFSQVLLCNPCGLWLFKMKAMRPENKWNKQPTDKNAPNKKKRPVRNRTRGGPLSNPSTRTRSQVAIASSVGAASSPAPTEASSVQPDDGITPHPDDDLDQDEEPDPEESPNKRRRANSAEPHHSDPFKNNGWEHEAAVEALRRAIQSSPARNMATRNVPTTNETNLTPKPLRRALFSSAQKESPLKELDASMVNSCSPRRSPRIATTKEKRTPSKENRAPTSQSNNLDCLFEGPSLDFNIATSPTPRRRNNRAVHERRLSLPSESPSSSRHKDVGLSTPSTRLTAERLQRVQGDEELDLSPRQRASSKANTSPFSGQGLQPGAFDFNESMMLDIFDDAAIQPDYFELGGKSDSNQNWTDWLPSNYVSPNSPVQGDDQGDDLIDAIFSDPTAMKGNLHNSALNMFSFGPTDLPDSGFFSSDALQMDSQCRSSKSRPQNPQPESRQTGSPDA